VAHDIKYNNPLQMVYDTLWAMLEEDERFQVKEGNRLSFNKDRNDRDVIKSQMSTSDYPEVILVAEAISTANLCSTSSSTKLVRNYSWIINAGDFRYSEIFPIEWAIFTGMLAWRFRLSTLEWEDELFVKRLNFTGANIGQIDNQLRRGIKGWISVWTLEVEMHFTTSKILGKHLLT
jgi:hypothetical protein